MPRQRHQAAMTALALAAVLVAAPARAEPPAGDQVVTFDIPYSTFLRMGQEGKFKKVEAGRTSAEAVTVDGQRISTRTPPYNTTWIEPLTKAGVNVAFVTDKATPATLTDTVIGWVVSAFGVVMSVLMLLMMVFMIRYLAGSGGGGIGRKAGRKTVPVTTTFDDVAGAEEAKSELTEIVAFLKDPSRFSSLGARTPRGVLLVGDPGNGKTLLAKAVAGEAKVPFHFCSGSDFVEMFVGLGASRVRRIFRQARKKTPSILFIDEIDAVGQRRSSGVGGDGAREHDQTLNALLTEMDGLATKAGLVVVAATNRIDVLDPALLRSGRFDRHIVVAAPGVGARAEILRVHARKVRLADDADLDVVARGTPGFSGADLEALVNEAALEAAREGSASVARSHLEAARDRKLLGGAERKGAVLDPEEIRTIAVHEAGHALAAVLQPESDPVHKATIIPRGRSLGHVARLPERDRLLVRRSKLMADLVVAMGGRAAEEAVFGADNVTGGAASDIHEATRVAREMVARYGLGASLSSRAADAFGVSEETRRQVDDETEKLVRECYDVALGFMTGRRASLDALSAALLERETLDGDEVRAIVAASDEGAAPVAEAA